MNRNVSATAACFSGLFFRAALAPKGPLTALEKNSMQHVVRIISFRLLMTYSSLFDRDRFETAGVVTVLPS